MATRSFIAMEKPDGSYKAIYCHWDGYPGNNGKILLEHYQAPSKVEALIALGGLSTLGKEIGQEHPFPEAGQERTHEDWCLAYCRDRHEDYRQSRVASLGGLSQAAYDSDAEWIYIFTLKGEWICAPVPWPYKPVKSADLIPVAEAIEKDR